MKFVLPMICFGLLLTGCVSSDYDSDNVAEAQWHPEEERHYSIIYEPLNDSFDIDMKCRLYTGNETLVRWAEDGEIEFFYWEPPLRKVSHTDGGNDILLIEWILYPEYEVWTPSHTTEMRQLERENLYDEEWRDCSYIIKIDYQLTILANETLVKKSNHTCDIWMFGEQDEWELEEEIRKECFGGLQER